MSTPIVMPQMGESIAEGTIVRWMKKVGDRVERDEPLFEITTDKVDAEIPSPAAGVLTEIAVREGETVAVNTVVGTIGQPGEDEASAPQAPPPPAVTPAPARSSAAVTPPEPKGERLRQRSSPLVRRIAREHNVDIAGLTGSGIGGRVTKKDILAHLGPATPPAAPRAQAGEHVEIRPLSPVRKKIAEHMVLSRRTSAHVHSVFHVDFTHVEQIRLEKKAAYADQGARLTYMAFIAKAVVNSLKRHPVVNASLDGDNVVYRKDVHLGIAVALESGLIVPVIRAADEKDLLGLSRAIADMAERARAKQLRPDDVHGGTFTITNPGHFGAQFGMPIINQPQVAILGVGTIERRPVVVDDAVGIRTMAYLTLGFDHRLIDGAAADAFMADVKAQLEHFDVSQV